MPKNLQACFTPFFCFKRLAPVLLLLGVLATQGAYGQFVGDYLNEERVLYAETKQVNQFFRRFNAEEAPNGKRFYPTDASYRDSSLRREYLKMLFDVEMTGPDPITRSAFVEEVMKTGSPVWLDFHGGDWFAEVATTFLYQGKPVDVLLFLELEKAPVGSKWVFTNVYFEPFRQLFSPSEEVDPKLRFIHPLSHELDFMNLIKVFRDQEHLEAYAQQDYQPDYLTLFLYEMKRGNLAFQTVRSVQFHFFQVDGWYFKLKDIQHEAPNRGWLISQLARLEEGNKELLLEYIYRK